MSLSPLLVDFLADALTKELGRAALGHCLRVDHLSREDGQILCQKMRGQLSSDALACVLVNGPQQAEVFLRPEEAIEIRNRKRAKLCLFVPADLVDASASSLSNAFAAFDLQGCFQRVVEDLREYLPEAARAMARRARGVLRGRARPSAEDEANYLASVLEDLSVERAGAELWRLGLIPDIGREGILERLVENRRCVELLVRPARPQTTPAERIEALGLAQGAVRDELVDYLLRHRLSEPRQWLRGMTQAPYRGRITFERWTFEASSVSDLEAIEIEPLLDAEGNVEAYTKLSQSGGSGTQPVAAVGPKHKVVIKWKALPEQPSNLKRWRAELIPSRAEYAEEEVAGIELPIVRTSARTRRASIPLDLDLAETPIRCVQVRVVGLGERDAELRSKDDRVIEGVSDEFWLAGGDVPIEVEPKKRRDTVPTLPYAWVKAAMDLDVETLDESPGEWSERDLHYYSVTLNGRRTSRIGLSPVLRAIEARCLENPEEGGRYQTRADIAAPLPPEGDVNAVGVSALCEIQSWSSFLAQRKEFFRLLRRQGPRGLVETAEWTPELATRARAYAKSYRELLSDRNAVDSLREALTLDTLEIEIVHTARSERAMLVLPTHPLRVLWYAAYADLLRHWASELLKIQKERGRHLDVNLLDHVAPINCPVFVPGHVADVYVFAQNLRFFTGVALPLAARDPLRRVAEVAQAVGLSSDEASVSDLPPGRLAAEFRAYREVHPYLDCLRLNVLNPGSGDFIADALRELYSSVDGEDVDDDTLPPPRVEVIAHAHEPIPLSLPGLTELQRQVYGAQPQGRRSHLSPAFVLAVRPMREIDRIPGGDANISVVIDQLMPRVTPVEASTADDSSSFYGLLVRLLPRFESSDGAAVWQHYLSLPADAPRERHPVFGPYTNDLVDTQRVYLEGVARLISPASAGSVLPGVAVELSPEDRLRLDGVHHQSDWVITLDRFFGVEFYDDPADPNLSRVARKYLLDYAPEFLEGLGHRMLVTTAHREEVEEILARAMRELGFGMVEESVGEVLHHLKTISGRLALRILGDDAKAREAVSLGVVAAYLRARGELVDSILIPVDSHPELFAPQRRRRPGSPAQPRCDLIRVQFLRNRLVATFVEVKSRAAAGGSEELLNRIADQIEATEAVFRDLFFRKDPVRLDNVLQRSRLVAILRFYLRRARRYGLVASDERLDELQRMVGRLESGIPDLRAERLGFVVNLAGKPQRPTRVRETEIRFLTARDLVEAGYSAGEGRDQGGTSADAALEAPHPPSLPRSTPAEAVGSSEHRTRSEEGSIPIRSDQTEGAARIAVRTSAGAQGISPLVPMVPPRLGHPEDASTLLLAGPPGVVAVELGLTEGDQEPVSWQASVRGSPHLFMLGIPGQGKSWTTTRILCELARQGLPSLVIDFHGQFGDANGSYARVASPTVLDATAGLPFSPFEADTNQAAGTSFWRTNSFTVAEIFQYVCELGDIQRDVVYEALRDCYRDLGFEEGEAQRLPTVEEVRRRLEEIEQERGIRNVMPRCRPLLELGLFQEQSGPPIDLRDLLWRGLVVDVHALGLETLQLAAGAFLLRKIYKDMFRWGEAERLRLAIVLDEAHRLARDITLPKIMKEGRKFGIAVVVASQGLADYHPDVVGNAGTKVVFRTNFPMSKKVAGFLRSRKGFDLAAAIEQLDVGEAYVQTPDMITCARVRMHPLET